MDLAEVGMPHSAESTLKVPFILLISASWFSALLYHRDLLWPWPCSPASLMKHFRLARVFLNQRSPHILLLYWRHDRVLLSQSIHDTLITLDTEPANVELDWGLQYIYLLCISFVSKVMYCIILWQNVRVKNWTWPNLVMKLVGIWNSELPQRVWSMTPSEWHVLEGQGNALEKMVILGTRGHQWLEVHITQGCKSWKPD